MKKNKDQQQKTVAVLFGGPSFEHEISILTGVFVLNILKRSNYNLLPVYVGTDGDFYTSSDMYDVKNFTGERKKDFIKILFGHNAVYRYGKRLKLLSEVDCAFNCCHGGWGEGGGVSALMLSYGIPLVAPDTALSGVFMDKLLSKALVSGMGIPSVRYTAIEERAFLNDTEGQLQRIEKQMGYPVIVKPAHLGSSIGVGVAKNKEELLQAVQTAFAFDYSLLIEEYLPDKRDINCAAYAVDGEIFVSECEEPLSAEHIFSFREKYLADGKTRRRNFPADIPTESEKEIKSITRRIYEELRFTGMVRADFLLSEGKVYFNEMNTVPGSLAYYLFTEKFFEARKLFCSLIEDAMKTATRRQKNLTLTGILQEVKFVGGKRRGK